MHHYVQVLFCLIVAFVVVVVFADSGWCSQDYLFFTLRAGFFVLFCFVACLLLLLLFFYRFLLLHRHLQVGRVTSAGHGYHVLDCDIVLTMAFQMGTCQE